MDFDGTACLHDVGVCILDRFAPPGWRRVGEAYDRGEMSFRELLRRENALPVATRDEMLAFALGHCPMDPTFPPFVAWLRRHDVPITVVSDGSGFHVEPLLDAAGLGDLPILTNEHVWDAEGRHAELRFPSAHPECVGCGTCKMAAVLRAQQASGAVAFVGDSTSDRYAALYADVVFAKDRLVGYCDASGVPYRAWTDFDDVRRSLTSGDELPGAIAPIRCPGWTTD